MRQRRFDLAIYLGLFLATLAVYSQVGGFDFVAYDDGVYVYENPQVQAGLTPESVNWALTAAVAGNWMPVTLLSHILTAQLFGMQSGTHHLVNVVLHALAAMFLFTLLRRATQAQWLSAFVALVFALHPLHVESVAWVAERKDVLSALFWFLGLYAYVHYAERPSPGRYLLIVAPFCLGLMSKPMLVTFPFTLLLFDLWPLRRFQWPRAIWEKLPLFALSAAASVVTFFVQKSAEAVVAVPLATRISNVFVSYVGYIGQMFWPAPLAIFYQYPRTTASWQVAAAVVLVLAVSALVLLAARTRPYLVVGWLWYIGTMVPVIGLVPVGRQAHADRYMYIPMVGLLVMLAWGAADIANLWPRIKPAIAALAMAACAACMVVAWKQTAHWKNTETLFKHAIEVIPDNWLAEDHLAIYLRNVGLEADAVPHFEAILRVRPDDAQTHNNLGASLSNLGDCDAAIPHFEAALRGLNSDPAAARGAAFNEVIATRNFNLGGCLATTGNYAGAIPYFEAAIRANPRHAMAHFGLAVSLSKIPGRASDAIAEYEAVLRLTPDDAKVQANFGELLASLGRTEEAIAHLEAARRISPSPGLSEILVRLRAGQK